MAGAVQLAAGNTPNSPAAGSKTIYPSSGSALGPNGENIGLRWLTVDQSGGISQLSQNARINYLRNGGFWFAQRQGASTATTYSSTAGRALSADGWGITNENASATYQRIDTSASIESGLQSRFYGQFLKITSTGKLFVCQVIEGTESIALRNRTIRFQVWLKGTTAATWRVGLIYLNATGTLDSIPATFISAFNGGSTDPTLGTNLAKISGATAQLADNSVLVSNALSCSVTTSWQRFSGVWNVPNDCKNLIPAIWSDSQVTATNGINIGQASLTDGYEIQDWTPQSQEIEFARCRRFFQRSFAVDTVAPQQNAGTGTGEVYGMAGKAGALAEFIPIRYMPQMRGIPTLTLFNPSAANTQMRDVSAAGDCASTSTAASTLVGVNITSTGNAGTAVGNQLAIHFTADAEI